MAESGITTSTLQLFYNDSVREDGQVRAHAKESEERSEGASRETKRKKTDQHLGLCNVWRFQQSGSIGGLSSICLGASPLVLVPSEHGLPQWFPTPAGQPGISTRLRGHSR